VGAHCLPETLRIGNEMSTKHSRFVEMAASIWSQTEHLTRRRRRSNNQPRLAAVPSASSIKHLFQLSFLALSESASYLTSHSNFVSREKFLWDSLSFFFKELDASCIEAFSFCGGQKLS